MKKAKVEGKKWKTPGTQFWVKPTQGNPIPIQPDKKGQFNLPEDVDPLLFELRDDSGTLISCKSARAASREEGGLRVDMDEVDAVLLKRLQQLDRRLQMKQQARELSRRLQEKYTPDKNYVYPHSEQPELRQTMKSLIQNNLKKGKEAKTVETACKLSKDSLKKIKQITSPSGKAGFDQLLPYLRSTSGSSKYARLPVDPVNEILDELKKEAPDADSAVGLLAGYLKKQPDQGVPGLLKRAADAYLKNGKENQAPPPTTSNVKSQPATRTRVGANQLLETALTNLIRHWGNFDSTVDERQTADGLRDTLKDKKLEGAPSDNAAIYDYYTVRVALPNVWYNYFTGKVYEDLLKKYNDLWTTFQNDLAWKIPPEIMATAQIEDLLAITDELGLESEVLQKLQSFGIFITEREYIALGDPIRSRILYYIDRYEALTSIETAEEIEVIVIEEAEEPSYKYYKFPGNPQTNPLIKEGGRYYIQLTEPIESQFAEYETFEPNISTVREKMDDRIEIEKEVDGDIIYNLRLPYENEQLRVTDTHYVLRVTTYQLVLKRLIQHIISEFRDAQQGNNDSGYDLDTPVSSSIEALSKFLTQDKLPFGRSINGYDIFAPRSVNFGIALKYSQVWWPFGYQAGDLVKTLPLAPGETRKFKTKTNVKKTRKAKEQDSAIKVIGDQSQTTGRVESEVVKKAQSSQSFASHAEASGEIGMLSVGGSSDVANAASKDSTRTRRNMREAVSKASQQFKSERKMEVETFESTTTEQETTGEISNPNNEIVVTYLFYELQRRFMVLDALTGITPVVLVAAKVPRPSEVTESFLIQYDWILRRVLLDDSYNEVFEIIKDTQKSRQVEVGVRKRSVERQIEALRETREQLAANRTLRDRALDQIEAAVGNLQDVAVGTGAADFGLNILTGGLAGLFGGTGGLTEGFTEAAQLAEETAQEALQRIDREINALRTRLEAHTTALEQAIDAYAKVVRETLRREQLILRARVHIAQNILYYMQAVWQYQYKDQRFFELFDIEVPVITGTTECTESNDKSSAFNAKLSTTLCFEEQFEQLQEIADLDTLMGFFGNYLIFPMKEEKQNPLTHAMACPYQSEVFPETWLKLLPLLGSADSNSITILSFLLLFFELIKDNADAVINVLKKILGDKVKEQEIRDLIETLGDISWQIVSVPSGHTHIEALPGTHPVLEDFKLKHRMHDMRSAEAESIIKQVESIRHLLRLSNDELSDPDVDKRVEIHGNGDFVVDTE